MYLLYYMQNRELILVDKITKNLIRIGEKLPHMAIDQIYDDESEQPDSWTNGFWVGILIHMFKYTNNKEFLKIAKKLEGKLDIALNEFEKLNHDIGFIWHLSSVPIYNLTESKESRNRALRAASYLASRFNCQGNFIRAWNVKGREGWAIIDCMMNLPLLYWASNEINDPRYYHIAKKHTDTVMKDFVRKNGSVCHIVKYDPYTGKKIGSEAGQGYGENSSWTRGTAWALYGFLLGYKYTNDDKYLETAKKIGGFIIKNLPADHLPRADYLAPIDEKNNIDSSAGAITVCGFLLLYRYTKEQKYYDFAINILNSLDKHCLANNEAEPILKHSCGAYMVKKPNNDCSSIYGDYFYTEAIMLLNDGNELF